MLAFIRMDQDLGWLHATCWQQRLAPLIYMKKKTKNLGDLWAYYTR